MQVSCVKLTTASPEHRERGLLGWISCVLDGKLKIDGVTLRRTMGGRLSLSFPTRTDAQGCQHQYIRPLSNDAREWIESEILDALAIDEFL